MSFTKQKVVDLARQWIGTPYHHQASLKGVGADCLGLVRGVYKDLYSQDAQVPPAYSPDWAEAKLQETLLEGARRHLLEVGKSARQPGDILVFRFRQGVIAKHAAILSCNHKMIHAIERARVSEVHLSAWWLRRIAGVFRFPGVNE